MASKRIVLVGYPAVYFLHFAQALEQVGFEVHWICGLAADAAFLRQSGVPAQRVLDINQGFQPDGSTAEECRGRAHRWEGGPDEPTVNDIILMDRLLVRKPPEFALCYLAHVGDTVAHFLRDRGITLATSWRDTALQLMSMLVCKRLGVPFVIPTRARIPQEMYGFCTSHHTGDFVSLRDVTDADRLWAEAFLHEFQTRGVKPALKRAARGLSDVARMLPVHARAFLYELRRAPLDRGNDYARYPIPQLVAMYLRRKFNLLAYKLAAPARTDVPLDETFCLYALHTQPESSIDVMGSYFSDQVGLIRFMARSLPADHLLYVKVHPTDVDGKNLAFYQAIKAIPGVRLVDFVVDSRLLLQRAKWLFALSGTIAYEAGLLGKPVIAFAKNFFNDLPTIRYCDAPPRLPGLVAALLSARPADPAAWRAQTLEFLARLRASCFDGEVSRFHISHRTRLTDQDLATVQRAYLLLHARLVERAREAPAGLVMQEAAA